MGDKLGALLIAYTPSVWLVLDDDAGLWSDDDAGLWSDDWGWVIERHYSDATPGLYRVTVWEDEDAPPIVERVGDLPTLESVAEARAWLVVPVDHRSGAGGVVCHVRDHEGHSYESPADAAHAARLLGGGRVVQVYRDGNVWREVCHGMRRSGADSTEGMDPSTFRGTGII